MAELYSKKFRFIEEVESLRKNFIPKVCPSLTSNSIWNKVIDEVKWMALDFREERKWKIGMAFFISKRIKKLDSQKKTHQKEKKHSHQLLCSHLSQEIVKKWVTYSPKRKESSEMEIESVDRDILGIIDANLEAEHFEKGTIKHFMNRSSDIIQFTPIYAQIDRKFIVEKLKKDLARWPKNKNLVQNHQFFASLIGKPSNSETEILNDELPLLRENGSIVLENKKKKKSKKSRWNSNMLNEGFEIDPMFIKNFENSDELLNFFFDETEIQDEGYKDLFPLSVLSSNNKASSNRNNSKELQ
mgnify:CR=1 FL=1